MITWNFVSTDSKKQAAESSIRFEIVNRERPSGGVVTESKALVRVASFKRGSATTRNKKLTHTPCGIVSETCCHTSICQIKFTSNARDQLLESLPELLSQQPESLPFTLQHKTNSIISSLKVNTTQNPVSHSAQLQGRYNPALKPTPMLQKWSYPSWTGHNSQASLWLTRGLQVEAALGLSRLPTAASGHRTSSHQLQ